MRAKQTNWSRPPFGLGLFMPTPLVLAGGCVSTRVVRQFNDKIEIDEKGPGGGCLRCWGAPKLCLVVTYDSCGILVGWVGPAPVSFAASLSFFFF